MRVVFAADHAGARLKDELLERLGASIDGEHELIDLGGDGSDPQDDYPDFARRLGLAIQDGTGDRGILICGSGVGRRLPRTRCGACARRSATTRTAPIRASSTTT